MADDLVLPRRALRPRTVVVGALVLWLLVFAKVGSSLIYGIDDLIVRVRALPDLIVTGNSTSGFKNWSVLASCSASSPSTWRSPRSPSTSPASS
jgi:hypothetical protein